MVDLINRSLKVLEFKNVSFSYANTKIIDSLSWILNVGEFHTVIGRSGCGKSTLLDLASGLSLPDVGVIEYLGVHVTGPISNIGFVFQEATLLNWMNVFDNILLPISLRRKVNLKDKQYLNELLIILGIDDFKFYFPWQLSGGQQSRVAIARALINCPQILMLDEPFASLDAITRDELQEMLYSISRKQNIAVIFITHDVQEAVFLSDYVYLMSKGSLLKKFDINFLSNRTSSLRYSSKFNEYTSSIKEVLNDFK
jgi:NitT/TauT family transport system ATP-binding protein